MNANLLKLFSVMFAATAVLSSCNDSDPSGGTYESSLAQCLTYGQNTNTFAQNFNKMSFSVKYEGSSDKMTLSVIGMVLPDAGGNGISVPRMEINELRWQYNSQGWKVTKAENVIPVITGMSDVPVFKELNFCVADVFNANGGYSPGIQYDMVVSYHGEEFRLVGCCMAGTTEVTAPDGDKYSPESDQAVKNKPVYWVDFDFAESTADIHLYNAKFLSNMPALNLVFPDVPYTIDNGTIVLKAEAFNPMFGGVTNPAFPISGLKGTIDYTSSSMKLDFTCNYRGADYTVKIDCKY